MQICWLLNHSSYPSLTRSALGPCGSSTCASVSLPCDSVYPLWCVLLVWAESRTLHGGSILPWFTENVENDRLWQVCPKQEDLYCVLGHKIAEYPCPCMSWSCCWVHPLFPEVQCCMSYLMCIWNTKMSIPSLAACPLSEQCPGSVNCPQEIVLPVPIVIKERLSK